MHGPWHGFLVMMRRSVGVRKLWRNGEHNRHQSHREKRKSPCKKELRIAIDVFGVAVSIMALIMDPSFLLLLQTKVF